MGSCPADHLAVELQHRLAERSVVGGIATYMLIMLSVMLALMQLALLWVPTSIPPESVCLNVM